MLTVYTRVGYSFYAYLLALANETKWNKTQVKLCRLEMVDTWWYQVSMEWYWLVLGGTGSVEGGTG